MSTTTLLAIWGAILSTALAVIEVIKFRRDKSNVKVSVRGGFNVVPADHPSNLYGDKSLILITAVNDGRRPVFLTRAGLVGKRGMRHLLLLDSVTTIELNEGQYHQYQMLEEDVEKTGITPNEYVAFIVDATGKTYYSDNIFMRYYKVKRIK